MKLTILIFIALCWMSCNSFSKRPLKPEQDDQVVWGKKLVQSYGCISCHEIPGMVGNSESIGPSLKNWSKRKYIAGEAPNRHKELTLWLMKPHAIDKQTTMPALGLSKDEASAIATYLATLGE